MVKLKELEFDLLHCPTNSSDISSAEYHLFHNLENVLIGKQYNSHNAVKLVFQEFFDSRPTGFCTTGLNNLSIKWQKCIIDNQGTCFDN
ncbi:histone-lysine N-methyltransferase SETMAR [Nephila pilipes]|uniref:Histone-lysine N-methyltransferase SETMAR n=1 Tax=Nephila pilipes TaxID=299642 RepID=A0A8X6QN20_NEPPI|nr:histone-lysine N-methyltransferase SETMAR [Nephila pilipes]